MCSYSSSGAPWIRASSPTSESVTALLCLVLFGPGETIAGKYIQHSEEYREARGGSTGIRLARMPRVEDFCRAIERNGPSWELMSRLGVALLAKGETGRAFRAFERARELGHPDSTWVEAQKDRCKRVPQTTIADERKEARLWVEALQNYERAQLRQGRDPDDLEEFYARYGKPEENMYAVMRARRLSFVGGVIGVLLALGLIAASRALPRKAALVPFVIAGVLALAPSWLGQAGILLWGAGFLLASAVAVAAFPKRTGSPSSSALPRGELD